MFCILIKALVIGVFQCGKFMLTYSHTHVPMSACKSEEVWAHSITLPSLSWDYVVLWLIKCYYWEMGLPLCCFHIPVTHSSDTLQWHTPSNKAPPPNPNSPPTGNQSFRYMSHSHSNRHRRGPSPLAQKRSRPPAILLMRETLIYKYENQTKNKGKLCIPVCPECSLVLNWDRMVTFWTALSYRSLEGKASYVTVPPQICVTRGKGCLCLAHS